jgi:hypothetical protein
MNGRPKTFAHTAERRQFGRRQTCLNATISASNWPSFPCVVRDLSAGGASIQVDMPSRVPPRVRLIVEAAALEADCEIVHRSVDTVGVRFVTWTSAAPRLA